MNQIVFSAGFVQANIFCSLLCILLPILFVWYQKRKNGVKPGAFFIGAAFCLLFSYVAATIVNVLIFSIPGLLSFFSSKTHPVYSALFGAFSLGILSTIGAFIGLKYAMKKRPGKENALIFGVGMGGFESILNGATVYITNIIAALLINSIGSTEYFKKLALKGEELAQTQKLFTEQAATPPSSFFMDATYVILSLVLYAAIAILVEYAISTGEKQWTVIAIVLHVAGYVPIYLRNIDIYKSSMTLFVIATVFTFAIALFAYQIYHRTENGKK